MASTRQKSVGFDPTPPSVIPISPEAGRNTHSQQPVRARNTAIPVNGNTNNVTARTRDLMPPPQSVTGNRAVQSGNVVAPSPSKVIETIQELCAGDEFIPLDIHTAASVGDLESVRELVHRGRADVNSMNKGGWQALHYSAYLGHDAICKYLIDSGCYIDAVNWKKETPLMLASCTGNMKVIDVLLKYGAKTHVSDTRGWTCLFFAVSHNHLEICERLLAAGCDCNVGDQQTHNITPFMIAAAEGHDLIVDLMLKYGADVHRRSTRGDTAEKLAILNKHDSIVKLLFEHRDQLSRNSKQSASLMDGPARMRRIMSDHAVQNNAPLVAVPVAPSPSTVPAPPQHLARRSSLKQPAPVSATTNTTNTGGHSTIVPSGSDRSSPSAYDPEELRAIFRKKSDLDYERHFKEPFEKYRIGLAEFLEMDSDSLKKIGVNLLGPRKKALNLQKVLKQEQLMQQQQRQQQQRQMTSTTMSSQQQQQQSNLSADTPSVCNMDVNRNSPVVTVDQLRQQLTDMYRDKTMVEKTLYETRRQVMEISKAQSVVNQQAHTAKQAAYDALSLIRNGGLNGVDMGQLQNYLTTIINCTNTQIMAGVEAEANEKAQTHNM